MAIVVNSIKSIAEDISRETKQGLLSNGITEYESSLGTNEIVQEVTDEFISYYERECDGVGSKCVFLSIFNYFLADYQLTCLKADGVVNNITLHKEIKALTLNCKKVTLKVAYKNFYIDFSRKIEPFTLMPHRSVILIGLDRALASKGLEALQRAVESRGVFHIKAETEAVLSTQSAYQEEKLQALGLTGVQMDALKELDHYQEIALSSKAPMTIEFTPPQPTSWMGSLLNRVWSFLNSLKNKFSYTN